MAGNANSGRMLTFRLTEKQLEEAIEKYKADLEAEKFPRASWPHFCSTLGYTEAEVQEVITQGDSLKGAYYERAQMLKRMITWIRGQILSGSGWSGQNQTKGIFALKQDFGDGIRYSDADAKQSGPVEVKISFGGSDPRAKKAAK